MRKLKAENESLRAQLLEAERLEIENRQLPELRKAAPAAASDAATGPSIELLRLRGEVSRLRAQPLDTAKLRAENEQLAAEIKSGKFAPKRLADMDGFVPREQWASAGLATPEAAVQSYFAAMALGDVDLFLRCLITEVAEPMRREVERDPTGFRTAFQKSGRPFGAATGVRIAGRRHLSDDTVQLHVQFAAEGSSTPMILRRVGNEWKITKWE